MRLTIEQYQAFLDDVGSDIPAQPELCAWNTELSIATLTDPGDWPITSVDWCDARAYCEWAGKHLCGAIGGGAVATNAALDQTRSQWFLACGGSVGSSHPNDDPMCNSTGGFSYLDPVGSNPGCEGWNPGVFDLEGNAAEWVDSCTGDTGADDFCLLLGGSYLDNRSYCTEQFEDITRDTTADPFGFRCCSG